MAIYKTSNHIPNLQEIDLTQNNTFSCMVNTSGESIKAYKMQILSGRGDQVLYAPKTPTALTKPVKNKGILKIENVNNTLNTNFLNGKDYQWGVRVYNQAPNASTQPNTLVCDGFLVGSTKYVIWCKIENQTEENKDIVDQIVYDRYIEFDTTSANMIKGAKDDASIEIPASLRERRKIDWVTKELGYNKNILKIETTDNFTYNYIDGTSFKIFQCSDEHTLKSFFADPNSNINVSNYVVLFNSVENAKKAHDDGYVPSLTELIGEENPDGDTTPHTAEGIVGVAKKIIGYSSDTGEIRLAEAFDKEVGVPKNGYGYLIFEYDSVDKICKEVLPQTKQNETLTLEHYKKQVVGGQEITNNLYKVMTNRWDNTAKRLFIQPNINIKSDETNPNELIFDDGTKDGIRIDIRKQYWNNNGVEVDITFDKLDNTQWLLTTDSGGKNISSQVPSVVGNKTPPIIPQTDYKVYTDFMDSAPYNLFYARKTPLLTIQCRNYNSKNKEDESYKDIKNYSSGNYYSYREIEFNTVLSNAQQEVKYYYYILYDEDNNIINKSDEIYSSEIVWYYRGFESGILSNTREVVIPKKYTIEVVIVDEYNSKFTQSIDFGVYYKTDVGLIPFIPTMDFHEKAVKISAYSPVYVQSTDLEEENLKTLTTANINRLGQDFYVNIPKGQVLNYTNVINEEKTPIVIPEQFSLITQFQITGDFVNSVPNGGELEICSLTHKISDGTFETYSVRLNGYMKFYMSDDNSQILVNNDTLRIKIYKNGEDAPLHCFSNKDYYDIERNGQGDFQQPENLGYALQNANDYIIVPNNDELPQVGEIGKKYVLTKDTKSYLAGIWEYSVLNGWTANYKTQFVFVENKNQLPNEYLEISSNCMDQDGQLLFEDEQNVYLDNLQYFQNINQKAFEERWFILYLVRTDNDTVSCDIKVNKGGIF